MTQKKITVEIPKPLNDRIEELIKGSSFKSVTEFIVFVLQDVVFESQDEKREEMTPYELRRIKHKLEVLGYL